MRTFVIASIKGGVGKTTMTSNLAVALRAQGMNVLVLDLDPQNAVRFHLGLSAAEGGGLAAYLTQQGHALPKYEAACGAWLVPYGDVNEDARLQFEFMLSQNDSILEKFIDRIGIPSDTIVLIDTPPGPSLYFRQAVHFADRVLAVVLADAASFATFPRMLGLFGRYSQGARFSPDLKLLVNQINPLKELSEDVLLLMRSDFPREFMTVVHQDLAVSEALAFRKTVFEYDPKSQASTDLKLLARQLLEK
ncbi:cellulose biosynthesis protein BcsQ [Limnobacter parvus]|uniref:Cellulose biosynthesis protein BcsQ n=1 Tax=Limnobacter parvus TaxID=2939690 RepID=A0ABT1XKR0_9BURK|nr:cellulose biosynthesis protein BcsQ [Limnobacter parvus]MCR2747878.1 cellulose biosynthesis protein BcsQ [Limnobacter parvus]